MSQAALSQPEHDRAPAVRKPAKSLLSRGLILAALATLLLFIASFSRTLYGEYRVLERELRRAEANAVIGYPGIQRKFSSAQRPADWFHVDGELAKLWGGWRHGSGHQWFVVNPGDFSPEHLSLPEGRDVYQAIDFPVVEFNGGTIWDRIPEDAHVAGGELAGVSTAYPILVLERVFVVNDRIRDQPFLVTYSPIGPSERKIAVFDPVVEGERVTMGVSGYFHKDAPMLYDRGTESLWVRDGEALAAIAGKHRGRKLRQVARPPAISWDRWREEHPRGRLVVGADRERAFR